MRLGPKGPKQAGARPARRGPAGREATGLRRTSRAPLLLASPPVEIARRRAPPPPLTAPGPAPALIGPLAWPAARPRPRRARA
ncbi:hypothetical protein DTB58_06945, partial [Streptomyces griseus]|nr:hypothetical protein [Streptomyces griseus]